MSASLRWLAVSMSCVFVLYLIPNLLSNNDCNGFVSEKSNKTKKERVAVIPHCYGGILSQLEPYEAAVGFWNFTNVLSETCQSPWFKMARRCLWNLGAYVRRTPESGDPRRVYLHYWFFTVMKSMFARFEMNMCKQTVYRYIFHIIDTQRGGERSNLKMRACLKMEPLCWWEGGGIGVCLEQKRGRR